MSTKTLQKRLALVVAVALGTSLVSAAAANATPNSLSAATVIATGNLNLAPATGATNPTSVAHVLNIASKLSTDGTTGTTLTAVSSLRSIGLLSVGDIAGTKVAGTTQTATLLSTGKLTVYTTGVDNTADVISVVGGTISANSGVVSYKSDGTAGGKESAGVLSAVITPNAGVTTMKIQLNSSNDTTPATAAGIINGTFGTTLTGQIIVTVVASNLSGALSAGKSAVYYADNSTGGQTADSTTAGVGTADWNTQQFANIRARDAYGVSVGSGGLLTATATNGAFVKLVAAAGSASPTASSDYYSSASDPDNTILVVAAPATAPLNTVVTVSWNGTVIGTKSFTFTGEVAKITISSALIGLTSGGTNTATISFADSAGNTVYITGNNTGTVGFSSDASTLNNVVTAISLSTAPSNGTTPGKITFTCGVAGTQTIGVVYTNISGTIVKSNALPVSCAGKAVSFTAAYDKTSYTPGSIATLSITFKDSKGNLAADQAKTDADNQTQTAPVISVAGLTAVNGTPTADGDQSTAGVISYTYVVGTTTGSFANSINFAQVGTNATAAGLSQKAITASLTIADGSTSLNDVLKGIVSLIASINKQIAALAKLVTKKK